eukprot:c38568_g1_i1 orf=1-189(-)
MLNFTPWVSLVVSAASFTFFLFYPSSPSALHDRGVECSIHTQPPLSCCLERRSTFSWRWKVKE